MKKTHDVAGFPYQLFQMKTQESSPIRAVNFTKGAPSLKKVFNREIKIYVIPDLYFVAKFREIFQNT